MQYQTKFISASDSTGLTKYVNDEERAGWEFVSMQVTPLGQDEEGEFHILFTATLRKPVK